MRSARVHCFSSARVGVVSRRGRRRRLVARVRVFIIYVRVLVLASVNFAVAFLAELLHLLEELSALLFGREAVALALLQLPLGALDELEASRHVVAEAGRRAARVEARAQEDRVLDHVAD